MNIKKKRRNAVRMYLNNVEGKDWRLFIRHDYNHANGLGIHTEDMETKDGMPKSSCPCCPIHDILENGDLVIRHSTFNVLFTYTL